jgi:ABC-type transport system, involved in lipoprotein release, permease component
LISTLEKTIIFRYLKPKKKDGFLNLISLFSFIGTSLGVAVLIIVMSVMNGSRTELVNKIAGFNSHIVAQPYSDLTDKSKSNNNSLKSTSNHLIFTNSGEGVLFNKEYTKGLVLRGYSKNDFLKLNIIKNGNYEGDPKKLIKNGLSIGKDFSFKL